MLGVAALVGTALDTGVQRVAELHSGIAERVFTNVRRGAGGAVPPVRLVHDGISGAVYLGVRSALRWGSRAVGHGATLLADGQRLLDHPRAQPFLAALNAAHGDRLDGELAALALPMTLRHDGADLAVNPAAVTAAYPEATGQVVVFLHGLGETERSWRYRAQVHHGDPATTYGTLLRHDLGHTPVWVRYNTGRRISDNGRALADLLARLVDVWPRPVERIVLIGHSMGGLVTRSAVAQAVDARWIGLVSDTVTLGSPHLGAPLEQCANRLAHALRGLPETQWLANQIAARSVGIKDLRHGNLIETDWAGFDPDCLDSNRTHIALHAGPRHFVVLATLTGTHDSLSGDLLGDLLVRPKSACGDTGDEHRLTYAAPHICRLTGLHHFDLLNHPAVYTRLRDWLTVRPGPPSR